MRASKVRNTWSRGPRLQEADSPRRANAFLASWLVDLRQERLRDEIEFRCLSPDEESSLYRATATMTMRCFLSVFQECRIDSSDLNRSGSGSHNPFEVEIPSKPWTLTWTIQTDAFNAVRSRPSRISSRWAEVELRVLNCSTVDRSIRDEPYCIAQVALSELSFLVTKETRWRAWERFALCLSRGASSCLHVLSDADRIICRDRLCASTSHTAATMSKDPGSFIFFFFFFSVLRKRAAIADAF